MNNTLVVEFVGPPGSGKTTNCNSFCAQLKSYDVIPYVFADVKRYLYKQKLHRKLIFVARTLLAHGVNLIRFTFLLVQFRTFSFDSVFRYVKLCLFNQALQAFVKHQPKGIVLLDQWVIQGLWSATIFKAQPSEKLALKLKRFYFPVDYVLYFDVSIETAAKRVATRVTDTSRFDNMSEANRLEAMKKFTSYLVSLYNEAICKDKWVVSTLADPEQNAEDFLNKLKQLGRIN